MASGIAGQIAEDSALDEYERQFGAIDLPARDG